MQQDILEKFTDHLKQALSRSIDTAWEFKQPAISPVILLYGLAAEQGSIAARLLKQFGITTEQIRADYFDTGMSSEPATTETAAQVDHWLELSDSAREVIERSARIAHDFQHQFIGTEHLLMALLEYKDDQLRALLEGTTEPTADLQERLVQILHGTAKFNNIQQNIFKTQRPGQPPMRQPHQSPVTDKHQQQEGTPALEFFGVDLTQRAQDGEIDPVIGRNEEIDRLVHILSRRTKNNPVLVGEPGVGKTAIVEGLARRITEEKVPDTLLHKRVFGLDLSLIVAGSMYRGEFESRLQQIIEELKNNPDILLFIDEIHTIVGAGGVQGGNMDAANILKPALAKGEISCIGATTHAEYRKHIEQDAALERRFQPITVAEPSQKEAFTILKGIRSYYEEYHHVTIPNDALQAAINLSVRYVPDKQLPDKAIDIIDEASAKKRVEQPVSEVVKRLARTNDLLRRLREQKQKAVDKEEFDMAVELKEDETDLRDLQQRLREKAGKENTNPVAITATDIAHTVAARTGVPVEFMIASESDKQAHLAPLLQKRIYGQDKAINKIASVMKRAAAGLHNPERPLGSFLFLGSSGIGKTELAKALAQDYFGDENALIRMDMSEFNEGFSVSKLVGAPAGYVGHNEGVKLADQIRKKPYSVVLFDELEKAHPDIFNVLLQILDDGRLTDSTGRELNFRNTIIIMTSNVGIEMLTRQAALGFEQEDNSKEELNHAEIEQVIAGELRGYFPIEFLNRIDHQVVFEPLTEKAVEQIVAAQFKRTKARLQHRGIKAQLLASAKKHIAKLSFTPDQGARRVQRMITNAIEDPLAELILEGKLASGKTAKIGTAKEKDSEGNDFARINITVE